jgi:hypothetical protein
VLRTAIVEWNLRFDTDRSSALIFDIARSMFLFILGGLALGKQVVPFQYLTPLTLLVPGVDSSRVPGFFRN